MSGFDIAALEQRGFTVAPKYLPEANLRRFHERLNTFIIQEAERLDAGLAADLRSRDPDQLPHDGLIALRNRTPEAMRRVVDKAKVSVELMSLIYGAEIEALARKALPGADKAGVLLSYPNFRADLPASFAEEEAKFSLPWHQESGYYKNQASRISSLVFHMTLFDCPVEGGALEVKPESHLLGEVVHDETFKDEVNKRHKRVTIADQRLEDLPTQFLETNRGDVGVFKFGVFHRSGRNVSDKVRYTLLIRASRADCPELVI